MADLAETDRLRRAQKTRACRINRHVWSRCFWPQCACEVDAELPPEEVPAMAVTDEQIAKLRLNDLGLEECREGLAGFLTAAFREDRGIDVDLRWLNRAISAYAIAVKTGLLDVAQAALRGDGWKDPG